MAIAKRASGKKKSTGKKSGAKPSGKSQGLKKLSQEADKTIEKDCGAILNALRDKATEGCIGCAKLLVQLAGRNDPEEETSEAEKPGESLAEWLVRDREWPGFSKPAKKVADQTIGRKANADR